MRPWCLAGILAAGLSAATPTSTVREVIDLVRAELRAKKSDGSIAGSIRKLKLSEHLDDEVIEALEFEGVGPKAAAELIQLRIVSEELKLPVDALPIEHPPTPGDEERVRVLADASANALSYARSLPDFICEELVKRSEQLNGYWRPHDELVLKLSYFQQHEDYKLVSVNGRPRNANFDEVGGATSQGEFGSILKLVFESSARFQWDHWSTLRKRPVHVFSFRIPASKSLYRIDFQSGIRGPRISAKVGQAGWIYVDQETKNILRIVADAIDVPEDFPIQKSSTTVDYDFTKVGQREFLLPIRADIRMTGPIITRNEVFFHAYRKFGAETSITFGQ